VHPPLELQERVALGEHCLEECVPVDAVHLLPVISKTALHIRPPSVASILRCHLLFTNSKKREKQKKNREIPKNFRFSSFRLVLRMVCKGNVQKGDKSTVLKGHEKGDGFPIAFLASLSFH